MVGFDSRSGSQRVETVTAPKTAQTEPENKMQLTKIKQQLESLTGVVYAETAGNNIPIAYTTRHLSKGTFRAKGLMIDTDANPVGSRAALEEAMQTDSDAFNFAAHTDAVHIETGVIIVE